MRKYLIGVGREYEVNWIQFHLGRNIIRFFAKLFKLNIMIGNTNYYYGFKPEREEC